MDAGGPRRFVFDTEQMLVVPLNEAAKGAKSMSQSEFNDSGIDPTYGTSSYATAYHKYAGSQHTAPLWPKEIKPCVAEVVRDAAVLRHIADKIDEPVFAFSDDLSSYFHQFALAPQELWKVCVLYQPLDTSHTTHS